MDDRWDRMGHVAAALHGASWFPVAIELALLVVVLLALVRTVAVVRQRRRNLRCNGRPTFGPVNNGGK